MPKVSICLPNLNTRPYLPERFETIEAQSLQNWELVVCDSYSDDGSWEYIQDRAKSDPRMRIQQTPRNGIYAGINDCIRESRGEYIYIATSDDTFAPDCLEKLVSALDAHPECDLAHCPLLAIGENANESNNWWRNSSVFARSSGGWIDRAHVRQAPFDGILHLYGGNVYTSLTQLLIRRKLFDRIGLFEDKWGSISDFSWEMRAGLVADVVHVPDTWGGWRIHPAQATAGAGVGTHGWRIKIDDMIHDALSRSETEFPSWFSEWLQGRDLEYFRKRRKFENRFYKVKSVHGRFGCLVKQFIISPRVTLDYLWHKLAAGKVWYDQPAAEVTALLRTSGVSNWIRPVQGHDGQVLRGPGTLREPVELV